VNGARGRGGSNVDVLLLEKIGGVIELATDKDKVRVGNRSMTKRANGVALILASGVVSYTKKKYGLRWDAVFLPKHT
jgi:hypothetical protein